MWGGWVPILTCVVQPQALAWMPWALPQGFGCGHRGLALGTLPEGLTLPAWGGPALRHLYGPESSSCCTYGRCLLSEDLDLPRVGGHNGCLALGGQDDPAIHTAPL